jgi:DNA polymerase III epsilon subunit-like protein
MLGTDWILIDTETTGFAEPIFVVELAAQRMRGWGPVGTPFRRLLNQNAKIPPEASRVHGYTREILERDGEPAPDVYRDFAAYADGLPIVSYNVDYDLVKVLLPEWKRLGIKPIGTTGFCALRLSQRLLDPVPAGNCKLQTLRQFYRLPERGAHTALGDVETVVDLLASVLRPIAEERGLNTWDDICAYTTTEWYPSRLAFGKFKGRDFRDAGSDAKLRGWFEWLGQSSNAGSAKMGRWYLKQLGLVQAVADDVEAIETAGVAAVESSILPDTGVTIYVNPKAEQLKNLIASLRARLAEVQSDYTKEHNAVELVQSKIFNLLREHFQARDRLRLIVSFRRKFIQRLLEAGEEDAAEVVDEFESAQYQSNAEYNEEAKAAEGRRSLSEDEKNELQQLWKELVRLNHPDRFAQDAKKFEIYGKLTSAINAARGSGDIATLREIGSDPQAFIFRQGWGRLDFSDDRGISGLRKLYDALQIELLETIELLTKLRESPEFELYTLSIQRPGFVEEMAADDAKEIAVEIVELEEEAAKLKLEIAELTGSDEQPIA